MTPRERWRAVVLGHTPDRVPCDYWATAQVTDRLMRELGCPTIRALWERLGIDKCIHLAPVHPQAEERDWSGPRSTSSTSPRISARRDRSS